MSRGWARQRERGSIFALRMIYWIGIAIGRWAARLLLYPITAYYLLTARQARRASCSYLQKVLARKPDYRHVFRHLLTFAATILDRIYLLAGEFSRFQVHIHNGELVLKQVQSGRGCILLGAHLGSFEVLRVLSVAEYRIPLKVLMNIDHNQTITGFMDSLSPQLAATVIPIGQPDTLLKAKESLEQGCMIGALGDRVVNDDKAVKCEFLGQEAGFPAGPLLMAAILKCPVILFFGLYRGGRCYEVYFEHFADRIVLQRSRRQADLRAWLQRYADCLERRVRSAPYNWFNFYDFWADADSN